MWYIMFGCHADVGCLIYGSKTRLMNAHHKVTTATTTTTVFRPSVRDYPGESVPEGETILDFAEAEMMGVEVASAEPYASYLHFAPEDNLSLIHI